MNPQSTHGEESGHQNGVPETAHSVKQTIIGYAASLVLTAIAFVLTLTHSMRFNSLLIVLMLLGGLQIIVQLFFFMHITERKGPPYHAIGLATALIFTFAIALMSIWIMNFGMHPQTVS